MVEPKENISLKSKPKYITRIGKVLSKSSKSKGFSITLSYTPDKPEEQRYGSLYFIIDIASISPLVPDIGYNLIDIIKEEYYRDLSKTPSQSFESALKMANEEFAAIAKEGEKSWVGKTNITIATITGNKLLAVVRGTSETHLWRNGKIIHLSEGMYTPGETYRADETLTNIIEGELSVGDKLILSTAELFYYLSVEKLKRIVEGYSPAGAAQQITQQLKNEEDITKTNVIIAEFSLPELIDFEEETAPEDNWIGQTDTVKQQSGSSLKPKSLFGGFSVRQEPAVTASVTDNNQKSSESANQDTHQSTMNKMAQELEIEEEPVNLPKTHRPTTMPKINYAQSISDVTSKIRTAATSPGFKKTSNIILRYLKYAGLTILAIVDLIVNFVSNWVNDVKKRPNGNKILITTVGILVVVIVTSTLSLARSHTTRVSKNVAVESLESAIQKRDAAKAAIIYEDNAKASTLLFEAYGLAEAATKNETTEKEALSILAEINTQLDEVGDVRRFDNPRALIDFASLASQIEIQGRGEANININNILAMGNDIYTYDTEHNKIFKYNDSRREVGIVNSLVSNEKKIKLGTIAGDNLIFYSIPAGIYSLNLNENIMKGISLDTGNWNNANDLLAYTDKLYFLDTENSNIWKYKQVSEGYTKIAPYFENNENLDLSGATNFVIDGDIYILINGLINKYTVGQQVEYVLRDVPEHTGALGTIKDIYTDSLSEGLYMLDTDNSRVVVFDKENGMYLRQYIFTGIDNPSNIFVSEENDSLWILSGTQVYLLEI